MEQEPVSCPTRQEPARLPRDCLTRLRGGTRRGQRSAAVSAAGPAAPEAQAAAETSLRPPRVPLGAPGIDLTAMLSLTSLPCHCLALTPRRGPSRVLTRLPPPEPRGPRRKPPPRPSRKTSANEPVGRRQHRAAPTPRAPRHRGLAQPTGVALCARRARRAQAAPGSAPFTRSCRSPRGSRSDCCGCLDAARGWRWERCVRQRVAHGACVRVHACAWVCMRAHACAGRVGGFGVKAAGPPRLTRLAVLRSHLALQDVAPRVAPGDCARGRRGWRRGRQGPGGRPPARPCPAVTSCGTEPRAAKPGAGACSPARPSDRGGGGPRSGGAVQGGSSRGRREAWEEQGVWRSPATGTGTGTAEQRGAAR